MLGGAPNGTFNFHYILQWIENAVEWWISAPTGETWGKETAWKT